MNADIIKPRYNALQAEIAACLNQAQGHNPGDIPPVRRGTDLQALDRDTVSILDQSLNANTLAQYDPAQGQGMGISQLGNVFARGIVVAHSRD